MHIGPSREFCLLRNCPITGQGSSLFLYACPNCRHVAVVSAELGDAAFPDPFHVTAADETNVDDVCSSCGKVPIRDFVTVEPDELTKLGLKRGIEWDCFPVDRFDLRAKRLE